MVVGYCRVSTKDQNLRMQISALENYGCEQIFTEKESTRKNLPVLQKVLSNLSKGDILVVYKIDRIGRSVIEIANTVNNLSKREIDFITITGNHDTTTSGGKLLFHVAAAVAEWERDIISERTRDGLKAAKEKGVKLGRRYSCIEEFYPLRNESIENIMKAGISKASAYRLKSLTKGIRFTFWTCNCGFTTLSYDPFIPRCENGCKEEMRPITKKKYTELKVLEKL